MPTRIAEGEEPLGQRGYNCTVWEPDGIVNPIQPVWQALFDPCSAMRHGVGEECAVLAVEEEGIGSDGDGSRNELIIPVAKTVMLGEESPRDGDLVKCILVV